MCSCSFENLDSVEINNTTHSYIRNIANQLTQTIYSSNFGSVSTRKVVACAPLPFYCLASFFNALFTSQVATAPIFVLEVVSWLRYMWWRQELILKWLRPMKLSLLLSRLVSYTKQCRKPSSTLTPPTESHFIEINIFFAAIAKSQHDITFTRPYK